MGTFTVFIHNLSTGKLTKSPFMLLYISALVFLVLAWTFSRIHYTGNGVFAIEKDMISAQGNFLKNPSGAWYFILSTIYMGACLSFFFLFLSEQLKPNVTYLSTLMRRSGISGGIGFIMVGFFQEGSKTELVGFLHYLGAIISFTGLGIGALSSLLIISLQLLQKKSLIDRHKFIITITMVSFFILMLWATDEISIKEWTGFYIIFTWANAILLILPDFNHSAVND